MGWRGLNLPSYLTCIVHIDILNSAPATADTLHILQKEKLVWMYRTKSARLTLPLFLFWSEQSACADLGHCHQNAVVNILLLLSFSWMVTFLPEGVVLELWNFHVVLSFQKNKLKHNCTPLFHPSLWYIWYICRWTQYILLNQDFGSSDVGRW